MHLLALYMTLVIAQTSKVSWYSNDYCLKHNPACITASGEKFDDTKYTAACSSKYKIGDRLLIKYGKNEVVVKCNDRGGFGKYGRELDLSKSAFEKLAPLTKGVLNVYINKL